MDHPMKRGFAPEKRTYQNLDVKITPEKANRALTRRKQFFSGVFFLTFSNLLTKFCGLFLKVPLTNTLGDTGMAYFNLAYAVYKWFYMISTAGLPVAAAVLTASAAAEGDPLLRSTELRRVRRLSFFLFCGVGIAGSLFMLAGAPMFAALQGARAAAASIAAIAPALLFICIASALRGWYQGLGQLLPASAAQVAEAAVKMGCGLLFGTWAWRQGYPVSTAAACAITGLTFGSFLGMAVMALFLPGISKRFCPLPAHGVRGGKRERNRKKDRELLGRLFRIAVPVTVSASVMSLCDMLDSMIVIRRLTAAGMAEAEALRLYGNYTALAVPMFNLPPILIYPITTALIPVIAEACAGRDGIRRSPIIRTGLSVTALIAMPCAAGMSVMAGPLLRLLFRDDLAETAAPQLRILAAAVFFLSVLAMSNAVLQAAGGAGYSMLSMTAGACVKLAASWILSGIPGMGIRSAPISTVLCYAVMAACSLAFTVKVTGIRLSPVSMLWKPGMASVLCAGSAAALYGFLLPLLPETAAVLLAVGFAACVYLAAIVLLRGIDRETLSVLLPALSGKKKK